MDTATPERTPITPDLVEQVAAQVRADGCSEETVARLRERFTGIGVSYCSDDDVGRAKPVLERDGFNIYLVARGDHCLSLTNSYDNAAGIVVAEVYED